MQWLLFFRVVLEVCLGRLAEEGINLVVKDR